MIMTPHELVNARNYLGLGPVAMARAMGVSYETLNGWESGRRKMPAVAVRCVEVLLLHPRSARYLASGQKPEGSHLGENAT